MAFQVGGPGVFSQQMLFKQLDLDKETISGNNAFWCYDINVIKVNNLRNINTC